MSTKGIVLKWGLVGGAVTIVIGILSTVIGLTESKFIQYLSVLLMLVIIVFALFEYRDKLGGGFASFKGLFKVGLMIGLIIAFITAIWTYVNFKFINPELLDKIILAKKINLEEMNLSQLDFENSLALLKKAVNPFGLAIRNFVTELFTSTMVSFVSALVIRNNKP